MTSVTAKPKPRAKPKPSDLTLQEALTQVLIAGGMELFPDDAAGVDDDELFVSVAQILRAGAKPRGPHFTYRNDPLKWGSAIWFSNTAGKPDFCGKLSNGILVPVDDVPFLLDAVRTAFHIPTVDAASRPSIDNVTKSAQPGIAVGTLTHGPERVAAQTDFGTLKAKGKSRAKGSDKTGPGLTSGPSVSRVVQSRVEIAIDRIDDSPWQTRAEPDAAAAAELAQSIAETGLLNPLRVRAIGDRWELIGGHRRIRALKKLERHTVTCDVIEADDLTAAREVLEHNRQEPLNIIERAAGYLRLWETAKSIGQTQREAAQAVGVDQSTFSNMIRMLEAPEELRARLISGEISQPQIRSLLPWCDRPGIPPRFLKELDNRCAAGPVNRHHWEASLWAAIAANSKSIRRATSTAYTEPGAPLFDCNKRKEDLEIVEVTVGGQTEHRAFNVELWNELQTDAKRKRDAKEKTAAAKTETGGKAKAKTAARTNREDWKFSRCMREAWIERAWEIFAARAAGKLTKPQKSVAVRFLCYLQSSADALPQFGEALKLTADEWLEAQMLELINEFESNDPPHGVKWLDVAAFAEHFGWDLVGDWKPTADLLNATELPDLQDLANEMPDADFSPATDKAALIKQLQQHWLTGWVPEIYDPAPKRRSEKKNA